MADEKVDVFFCNYDAVSLLRGAMASLCRTRWAMQTDIRLRSIYPNGNHRTFHIDRKRIAEQLAETPIYVVADDDCLIIGEDFVRKGVALMEQLPGYGIIGAWNLTDMCCCAGRRDIQDSFSSVGGVTFVRKGILKDIPDVPAVAVDETICNMMRAEGYRVGLEPSLRFNHIGSNYSLTTPGCWKAPGPVPAMASAANQGS